VNDAAKAVLALTNGLVDAGVPPLKAAELWPLLDAVRDPSTLLGRSAGDIRPELPEGVDADRIARLLGAGLALAARLGALDDRGIWTLTPFDPDYPDDLRARLGHGAPPVLYGAGASALLGRDAIGIVGSRAPSDASVDVARSVARTAVEHDLVVTSGGSPGIDRAAFDGALEAGGATVAVLADSLEEAIGRAGTRRALIRGHACLCTPYRPDLARDVARARGRNRIIYALGRTTLVVAVAIDADTTWAGATEAIERGYGPVAVWRGAGGGPDNEALEQAGAAGISDPDALVDDPGAPGMFVER
jgi:predicted Rossmann fold nucleotide-binding protein DprA/Smf involved in DNA uptake